MLPEAVRERVTSYIQHQGAKPPETIIELVETSQARFLETIAGVDEPLARKKPAPDEWSLHELIRHVVDAEEGVAALVERLARGQQPERGRNAGNMLADEGRAFGDYIAALRTVNARLVASIRELPASPDLDSKADHPFFGPLNCKEWAAFQRVHDEDHVQHAKQILAAVG